jgi:signal transduction histidine kinase
VIREDLRRAVINVVENAFHAATQPGSMEPTVTVDTRCEDDRLIIRIRDRGPGMSAEIQARVFEPLFSTKAFGVGLGLPTVKRVMQDHDGGVSIETGEGAGTTVCLWIPLADETVRDESAQDQSEQNSSEVG